MLPLKTAFIAHLKRELGVFSNFFGVFKGSTLSVAFKKPLKRAFKARTRCFFKLLAILPKVVPFISEFFSHETSDFYRLGSRSDVCELSAHHVKC